MTPLEVHPGPGALWSYSRFLWDPVWCVENTGPDTLEVPFVLTDRLRTLCTCIGND